MSFSYFVNVAAVRAKKKVIPREDRILSLGLIWQTVAVDIGMNARYVRIHFRDSFPPAWLIGKALFFANYVDKHTFVVMSEEDAAYLKSLTFSEVRKIKNWDIVRYDTDHVDQLPNDLVKSLKQARFRKARYLVNQIYHAEDVSYQTIIRKFKHYYV